MDPSSSPSGGSTATSAEAMDTAQTIMMSFLKEGESELQFLFLLGVITVFTSTRTSISGALRLAYLESDSLVLSFNRHLPSWPSLRGCSLLLSLVLAARSWAYATIILIIAWQYLLHKYTEGVHNVTKKVNNSCYRATVVASNASQHVQRAAEYEAQVLAILATARRDLRRTQSSLKVTDYFDVATESWSALGRITAPLETATKAARKVLEEAENRQDNELDEPNEDGGEGSLATRLYESAKAAVEAAEEMWEHARDAQDALKRVTDGRAAESGNYQAVATAAREFRVALGSVSADQFIVNEGAERVKWLAGQAKTLAEGGDFKAANSMAAEAEKEAVGTLNAEKQLVAAVEAAREVLWRLHLGE
ncbi:hypothetical protein QBC46DRAFT_419926 [Diplogelasinospora grovesii]|uniref:Uncharacterized protein n=1 Tax=Diplogelasinospora grovesii TaxID=303347 RepID=A0AAN6S7P5_9PEZI|nr:hypothetical protein QBC46DRAFT_419926 [Diplogelasinospora grovesii]